MDIKLTSADIEAYQMQLRKAAHLLRLEGNYVAAQETERQLSPTTNALIFPKTQRQQKSAA